MRVRVDQRACRAFVEPGVTLGEFDYEAQSFALAVLAVRHRTKDRPALLCREAGGMIAVLGGLDAIVFTGGVGENSPAVREALCRQMAFLGVDLEGQGIAHGILRRVMPVDNTPYSVVNHDSSANLWT